VRISVREFAELDNEEREGGFTPISVCNPSETQFRIATMHFQKGARTGEECL
jgi:hypothetical protein